MNPFTFVRRRPFATMMVCAAVVAGGIFGLHKTRAASYPQGTPKIYVYLDYVEERAKVSKDYLVGRYESYFHSKHDEGEHHEEGHKIVVTSPKIEDVVITQQYVCQIRSQRHIEIKALEGGYLEEIDIQEGQFVKKGAMMFKIVPVLYKAKMLAEQAKVQNIRIKYENTKKLASGPRPAVAMTEVNLLGAELAEAEANLAERQAELDFTFIKAPFDGIADRLMEREGSLIKDEGILTTLSDNSVMWVYFNVPEARYLEYMTTPKAEREKEKIELVLANGNKFEQPGRIGAIESKFNNENGNIAFRADFPNPEGLLRHGQTGTILIHRVAKDSMVIPQRCAFDNLAKRYVYVVGHDEVVHQREIAVQNEQDDLFVIKSGIGKDERLVLEGVRQLRDGEKIEAEFKSPEEVFKDTKFHAE